MDAILDTLPVGLIIIDTQGVLIRSNAIRDRIIGNCISHGENIFRSLAQLKGRWSDTGLLINPTDWPITRALKGQRTMGVMADIERKDGTIGSCLTSAAPLYGADGKLVGAIGVIMDVTQQRLLEQDALASRRQAELYLDLLINDLRDLSVVTKGNIEQAMTADSEKDREWLLNHAVRSIEEGHRIVRSVQRLRDVDSGVEKKELVDLGLLMDEVIIEQFGRLEDNTTITFEPKLKQYVRGSMVLKDAFANIIDNAITHSENGVNIVIEVKRVLDRGMEMYKVSIEDDGPGIPDDLKGSLFHREFHPYSRTLSTGLGLYLVRRVVEDHSGLVWAEDRVPGHRSKGTRIVVLLPAAASVV